MMAPPVYNPATGDNGFVALFLCELSGEMARPWAEAGYYCLCVDLQHPPGEGLLDEGVTTRGVIHTVGADLHHWMPPRREYAIACAFPDCTNLSIAGAKHFKRKGLRPTIDGLLLVERCREILDWCGCPWMMENPIGLLSTWWGEPDYIFDPCDFAKLADNAAAEAHTKKTCLWTGGGFVMPESAATLFAAGTGVEPTGHRPGQPNDWYSKVGGKSQRTKNYRSRTPRGFARAVVEANHAALVGRAGAC